MKLIPSDGRPNETKESEVVWDMESKSECFSEENFWIMLAEELTPIVISHLIED